MQWKAKCEIRSGDYTVYVCGSGSLTEASKYFCMKAYCNFFKRRLYVITIIAFKLKADWYFNCPCHHQLMKMKTWKNYII
jgi:nitrite reductase/ring-hydroxylating ferredoxin subunit